MFCNEFFRDNLAGFVSGFALGLECHGPRLKIIKHFPFLCDERDIPDVAMIRHDDFWFQFSRYLIQYRQPFTGRTFGTDKKVGTSLVLYDVAGEENAIRLNHDEFVALCMRGAKPKKFGYDAAAKIQCVVLVEKNIGLPDIKTL